MLDLVIRGGLVVTQDDVGERDIGVQHGTIVAVATPGTLPTEAAQVIEAQGHIVLPGGIEPHAHIAIPVPERWAGRPEVMTQPPEAASRAAAFGGVTTVIDFAGNLNPTPAQASAQPSIPSEIDSPRNVFRGHAYTDFHLITFWPAVSPQPPSARLAKRCRRALPVLKFLRPFLICVCPMATSGRCLPRSPSMGASWRCMLRKTTSSPT